MVSCSPGARSAGKAFCAHSIFACKIPYQLTIKGSAGNEFCAQKAVSSDWQGRGGWRTKCFIIGPAKIYIDLLSRMS